MGEFDSKKMFRELADRQRALKKRSREIAEREAAMRKVSGIIILSGTLMWVAFVWLAK